MKNQLLEKGLIFWRKCLLWSKNVTIQILKSLCYYISTLGLGEHAFEIKVIQSGTSRDAPCKIVVLGVKSIFVLHHSGVLAYSKKLDFNPVTMLTYPSCNKLPALSDNPMFKREKKVA